MFLTMATDSARNLVCWALGSSKTTMWCQFGPLGVSLSLCLSPPYLPVFCLGFRLSSACLWASPFSFIRKWLLLYPWKVRVETVPRSARPKPGSAVPDRACPCRPPMDREVSLRTQRRRSAFDGESAQPGWGHGSEQTGAAARGGGTGVGSGGHGERTGTFPGGRGVVSAPQSFCSRVFLTLFLFFKASPDDMLIHFRERKKRQWLPPVCSPAWE